MSGLGKITEDCNIMQHSIIRKGIWASSYYDIIQLFKINKVTLSSNKAILADVSATYLN